MRMSDSRTIGSEFESPEGHWETLNTEPLAGWLSYSVVKVLSIQMQRNISGDDA